jgi:signal transduction histidine kinase
MQPTGQAVEFEETGIAATSLTEAGRAGTERKRVEAVVETLSGLRGDGESLEEVAHDARNMVTALGLYCDLLEEPGVLSPLFHHYGNELRLVATASRRLVEKLVTLDAQMDLSRTVSATWTETEPRRTDRLERSRHLDSRHLDLMPAEPIDNLAGEVLDNRNLLAALAGTSIALTVKAEGGAQPVGLTGEELTRILVNLVKNAAEAMPGGGRIDLRLHEYHAAASPTQWLVLTVEDNGPGIPQEALGKIFESGYTTRASGALRHGGWPASHRGLGLSITRSIVEAAGGHVHATNGATTGARLEIELPVRSR